MHQKTLIVLVIVLLIQIAQVNVEVVLHWMSVMFVTEITHHVLMNAVFLMAIIHHVLMNVAFLMETIHHAQIVLEILMVMPLLMNVEVV